jgi:hypothetical protein
MMSDTITLASGKVIPVEYDLTSGVYSRNEFHNYLEQFKNSTEGKKILADLADPIASTEGGPIKPLQKIVIRDKPSDISAADAKSDDGVGYINFDPKTKIINATTGKEVDQRDNFAHEFCHLTKKVRDAQAKAWDGKTPISVDKFLQLKHENKWRTHECAAPVAKELGYEHVPYDDSIAAPRK